MYKCLDPDCGKVLEDYEKYRVRSIVTGKIVRGKYRCPYCRGWIQKIPKEKTLAGIQITDKIKRVYRKGKNEITKANHKDAIGKSKMPLRKAG